LLPWHSVTWFSGTRRPRLRLPHCPQRQHHTLLEGFGFKSDKNDANVGQIGLAITLH